MDVKTVIFQQKFTDNDRIFLDKILLAANIKKYELINSYYYDVEINPSALYITFGSTANDLTHTTDKVTFPSLDQLIDKKENEKYRQKAFNFIEIIKVTLESNKITNIKSLPINTTEELLKINKYAIENNINSIELIDYNNEKITVIFTQDSKKYSGKTILFSELIAIKLAMEIFNIKSIG